MLWVLSCCVGDNWHRYLSLPTLLHETLIIKSASVAARSRYALIGRYFAFIRTAADTCKCMEACGWAATESSPLVRHFSSWPPNQTNGVRPGRVSAGLSGDPVESSQLIVCLLCVNLPATPRPAQPCGAFGLVLVHPCLFWRNPVLGLLSLPLKFLISAERFMV